MVESLPHFHRLWVYRSHFMSQNSSTQNLVEPSPPDGELEKYGSHQTLHIKLHGNSFKFFSLTLYILIEEASRNFFLNSHCLKSNNNLNIGEVPTKFSFFLFNASIFINKYQGAICIQMKFTCQRTAA